MGEVRTQFTFYESFFKAVSRIRKGADRAAAYDAICTYALYGTEPDMEKLPDTAAIAFELTKPNLDASRRKAASGKKGGEVKQTESKAEANGKQTASKKESKKEKEKEKENECYPPISPLPNAGAELQAAFSDWLKYKQERREGYKPTGLKNLEAQVMNHAAQYGEKAVAELIRHSMASGWRGIIFDRLKKQQTGKGENGFDTSNPFLEMLNERRGNGDIR